MSTNTALSGLTYFVVMGPVLAFGLFSGALSDVHYRKRIFASAQWVLTMFVGVLCVLVYSNYLEAGHTVMWFLVLLLYGCAFSFVPTSRIALVGDIVDGKQIGSVSIVVNVFVLLAFSAAPMLTGFVAELYSWFLVYGLILVLFLMSNMALLAVPLGLRRRKRQSYSRSILGVIRYVFRNKVLSRLFALLSLIFICLIGPFQVLIPEYAKSILLLNEAEKGALLAFLGVGIFLGSVSIIFLKAYVPRGPLILWSNVLASGCFIVFSQLTVSWLVSLCLILMGFFGGAAYALVPSILQEEVGNQRRGRVMSLYIVFSMGIPALGGLLGSVLVELFGLVLTIVSLGVMGCAGVLILGQGIRKI
jgi:MFS family permease